MIMEIKVYDEESEKIVSRIRRHLRPYTGGEQAIYGKDHSTKQARELLQYNVKKWAVSAYRDAQYAEFGNVLVGNKIREV